MCRRTWQTRGHCHWHPTPWWTLALELSDVDYLKWLHKIISVIQAQMKIIIIIINWISKTTITYFCSHHRNVVPFGCFSVQCFQCCDGPIHRINVEQPLQICVSINGVSARNNVVILTSEIEVLTNLQTDQIMLTLQQISVIVVVKWRPVKSHSACTGLSLWEKTH